MRPLNIPLHDEQQIVVGRIDIGPLKRLNRPRPNGLQTVVVQGGVEVVCITLGNYNVEPQSREARLWLVLLIIHTSEHRGAITGADFLFLVFFFHIADGGIHPHDPSWLRP